MLASWLNFPFLANATTAANPDNELHELISEYKMVAQASGFPFHYLEASFFEGRIPDIRWSPLFGMLDLLLAIVAVFSWLPILQIFMRRTTIRTWLLATTGTALLVVCGCSVYAARDIRLISAFLTIVYLLPVAICTSFLLGRWFMVRNAG